MIAAPNTLIDNASVQIDSAPGSLRDGQSGTVDVTVTNIGTTTWNTPSHGLVLRRGLRINLPQFGKPVTGSVAPGQSQSFSFEVVCSGRGQGYFEAQMGGQGGVFGQNVARTVVCQP